MRKKSRYTRAMEHIWTGIEMLGLDENEQRVIGEIVSVCILASKNRELIKEITDEYVLPRKPAPTDMSIR